MSLPSSHPARSLLSFAVILALVASCGPASQDDPEPGPPPLDMAPPVMDNPRDFFSLDALLTYYRRDRCVDYRSMRRDLDARVLLATAQRVFREHRAEALDSREAKLAYWFNAYNTFMLQAVVDHLDLFLEQGVLAQIDGERIFAKRSFQTHEMMISLDMLEQGILRRDAASLTSLTQEERDQLDALAQEIYGDAPREVRLHFALNCAARGCPPLDDAPFFAQDLDARLDSLTRAFLNDPVRGAGPDGTSELVTSYYAQDFIDEAGSVDAFVKRYNPNADTDTTITYDWRLAQCD